MKAATVAAATGAFLAVGAQFAAGSASAAPVEQQQPFGLPEGALPPGLLPEAGAPELPQPVQDFVQQFDQGRDFLQQFNPVKPLAVQPVSGTLTSDFGARWGAHHGGIDIAAPVGTPVKSAAAGTVLDAGPASGYGQWVRVANDDGTTAIYGHVESYSVQAGQRVDAGQNIATVGNRGWSTGPHLHFEVWDQGGAKTDPSTWLSSRGVVVDWANQQAV